MILLGFSIKSYSNEFVDNLKSPLLVDQSRSVLLYGTSLSLLMLYVNKDFDQHNEDQISKHNILGKWSKYGNKGGQIIPNIAYTVINAGIFLFNDDANYEKRAVSMFNATFYSGLVADVIKPIAHERRPNGGVHSFPSGHTTTAFAFASYVALEHPWYVGVPAYVFASYVGLCRMNDRFHYPHDVVFGAALGMAYGMAQYYQGYINRISYIPMIVPVDSGKGLALNFTKEF
jgi:hypothetical protein